MTPSPYPGGLRRINEGWPLKAPGKPPNAPRNPLTPIKSIQFIAFLIVFASIPVKYQKPLTIIESSEEFLVSIHKENVLRRVLTHVFRKIGYVLNLNELETLWKRCQTIEPSPRRNPLNNKWEEDEIKFALQVDFHI